jgi:ketosteroid isomerase-like protein
MKAKSIINLVIPALMLLATAGCLSPQKENKFNLTDAQKEIKAANKDFVELFAKGDSVGVAGYFTADAKSMRPNEPSHVGRSKIQNVYTGLINAGINHLGLTTTGIWSDETMLAEKGLYTFSDKNAKELDRGKYIVLWKKEEGKWKLFRDCYNSDMPLPGNK